MAPPSLHAGFRTAINNRVVTITHSNVDLNNKEVGGIRTPIRTLFKCLPMDLNQRHPHLQCGALLAELKLQILTLMISQRVT